MLARELTSFEVGHLQVAVTCVAVIFMVSYYALSFAHFSGKKFYAAPSHRTSVRQPLLVARRSHLQARRSAVPRDQAKQLDF